MKESSNYFYPKLISIEGVVLNLMYFADLLDDRFSTYRDVDAFFYMGSPAKYFYWIYLLHPIYQWGWMKDPPPWIRATHPPCPLYFINYVPDYYLNSLRVVRYATLLRNPIPFLLQLERSRNSPSNNIVSWIRLEDLLQSKTLFQTGKDNKKLLKTKTKLSFSNCRKGRPIFFTFAKGEIKQLFNQRMVIFTGYVN